MRHFLDQKWSPQEISATLKRAFPDEPDRIVSHATIYNAIYAYPRGELRRQLIACLRQGRAKRLPRSSLRFWLIPQTSFLFNNLRGVALRT